MSRFLRFFLGLNSQSMKCSRLQPDILMGSSLPKRSGLCSASLIVKKWIACFLVKTDFGDTWQFAFCSVKSLVRCRHQTQRPKSQNSCNDTLPLRMFFTRPSSVLVSGTFKGNICWSNSIQCRMTARKKATRSCCCTKLLIWQCSPYTHVCLHMPHSHPVLT
jgi:hypothetical protein